MRYSHKVCCCMMLTICLFFSVQFAVWQRNMVHRKTFQLVWASRALDKKRFASPEHNLKKISTSVIWYSDDVVHAAIRTSRFKLAGVSIQICCRQENELFSLDCWKWIDRWEVLLNFCLFFPWPESLAFELLLFSRTHSHKLLARPKHIHLLPRMRLFCSMCVTHNMTFHADGDLYTAIYPKTSMYPFSSAWYGICTIAVSFFYSHIFS